MNCLLNQLSRLQLFLPEESRFLPTFVRAFHVVWVADIQPSFSLFYQYSKGDEAIWIIQVW